MNAYKRIQVCGTVCLAIGCLWAMTGCGGGDDETGDGGTTTTIVTNVVAAPGGGTTTVIATNIVADAAAGGAAAGVEGTAPELVLPADNATYEVALVGGRVWVSMQWTALPGVDGYKVEIDGPENSSFINPSVFFGADMVVGEYTWRVAGVYPSGEAGPFSEDGHFSIKQKIWIIQ